MLIYKIKNSTESRIYNDIYQIKKIRSINHQKNMGYGLNRFEGEVGEELLCPICSFILEDPVQVRRLNYLLKSKKYVFDLGFS